MNVYRGILKISLSVCLSMCPFVCVSFCVQKASFCQSAGGVLTLSQTSPGFYVSALQDLKTLGKREIACNEQFLLFP